MQFGIVAIPTAREADGGGMRPQHRVRPARRAPGLCRLWTTDAFGRGFATVDPLMFLSTLCSATERIELGTCVTQVPIRHPVELAHRAQTLHLMARGRFRFGVGSGSTKHDFDGVRSTTSAAQAAARTSPGHPQGLRRRAGLRPGTHGVARHRRRPADLSRRLAQQALDRPRCQSLRGLDRLGHPRRDGRSADRARHVPQGRRQARHPRQRLHRPAPQSAPCPGACQGDADLLQERSPGTLAQIADLGFDDALLIVPMGAPEMLDDIRELLP